MRLRRVEIAQFRKLVDPVVLDGLQDGLIVVSGDNEEGKSTVLAALKAALFEHHTVGGAVREAMTPHKGGVPEVAVHFEHGGRLYRLRKAFRKGGVVLETEAQRLQDDAAERRLLELLRFERRQGRSAARAENAGLQSLFWVDQATAFRDFEALTGGHDRLTAAIAAEVGSIAAGDGARRLMETARERAAGFFTAGRQQPTGALKAAEERLRSLEQEQQALETKRRSFEERVDRLAKLRADRRRQIEQDPIGRARQKFDGIRRQLAASADLERRAALAAESLKSAAAELAKLQAQARTRTGLVEEAVKLGQRRTELTGRLAEADRALAVLRAGADRLRRAATEAGEALERAESAAATARDSLLFGQLTERIERLEATVERCGALQETLRRSQAGITANPVTADRLATARKRQQERDAAAAGVDAGATIVTFDAPGRRVMGDGRAVDPERPLRLVATTVLDLDGFGKITIAPGGADLDQRQRALATAETALADSLAGLEARSLAEAEAAHDRRREAENEHRHADTELRAVLQANAAKSVEALAQSLADLRAEMTTVQDRLSATPDTSDPGALQAQVATCAAELTTALDSARAAAQDLEQAERRAAEVATAVAGQRGEQQAMEGTLAGLEERLALERQTLTDEALATAVQEAAERHVQLERACGALAHELASTDKEGLQERLAIAEREVADLEKDRRSLDETIRELEVALRETGADAWVERLAEIAGDLEAARSINSRLELEGRAWLLLAERLAAADQAVREALVAPISRRLAPLLARVFPGAEPIVDPERLNLTHLRRDGAEEAFDSLSVGAREQIAVLVRLAFAKLLAEQEGEAPCLILDDTLVYADESRFETMKALLQRASREMQIIVLTCRPRDYFGLDARYLRLEDCRAR
ncbi:MAG: AAA family ATPase [Geminicoccaceae bacterium]